MRALSRVAVASSLAAATLFACGGDGPELSDQAAADLAQRVTQVRAAAAVGDRSGAGAALAGLRAAVGNHRGRGQISDDRAARVLAAAADVEAHLALLAAPPPSPRTTAATSGPSRKATTVPDGEDGGDEEKGRGKGNGKGKED